MQGRQPILTICVLAVLALTGLLAETIFTRNFPIDGTYWVSVPASPDPLLTSAEELLAYGPFTSVARFRTVDSVFYSWNGTTCSPAADPDSQGPGAPCSTSCFCVIPGEGYRVTVTGTPSNWDIDGADGITQYQLRAPGPGSLSGAHLLSMPITLPAGFGFASNLRQDINAKAGTPIVVGVSRFITATNQIQTYTGNMGGAADFPLARGESYQVVVNGNLAYSPPTGPIWDNPCIEIEDNGTIKLPPRNCGYFSPADIHTLINGLPPGTTVVLGASHRGFFNITPVVSLRTTTTTETFDSDLVMHLTGTGIAAAVDCDLTMSPLHVVVESQPTQVGQPVQDFDTDMKSLTGTLLSDTSCNLFQTLTVTAGTDNGLPSPGHTHLQKRPDGTYDVASFFDVNVTLFFEGKPGSILEGMSGSTTAIVRMGTNHNLAGRWICGTNGAPCDDGNPCTISDACSGVTCAGTPTAITEVGPSVTMSQSGGTSTISWVAPPGSTAHDVLRGLWSQLPVGPGGGDEVCLADDLASPTASDSLNPGVGDPFWYLVRGENACTTGPYGFQGINGLPGPARISTTCP